MLDKLILELTQELVKARHDEEFAENDKHGVAWLDKAEGYTNGILTALEMAQRAKRRE